MRLLPLVDGRLRVFWWPIADRSAAALVELLLTARNPSDAKELASILREDPPLMVWLLCRAAQMTPDGHPSSAEEVAHWLTENAVRICCPPLEGKSPSVSVGGGLPGQSTGESDSGPPESPAAWEGFFSPPTETDRNFLARLGTFQRQVEKDVFRAELAARLAGVSHPALTSQAYFLGLVAEAGQWFQLTANGSGQTAEELLPSWLLHAEWGPVEKAVETARSWTDQHFSSRSLPLDSFGQGGSDRCVRAPCQQQNVAGSPPIEPWQELSGHEAPSDWGNLPDGLQERAAQVGRQWSESLAGLSQRFPELLWALARREVLEPQFTQALEQAKLEALAELAAGAAHEINNPLAVIAGRAQLLLHQETDPEYRRSLAVIVAQVRRAYEMIADLRLFARPPRPQMQPVELGGLLGQLIQQWEPIAAEQRVSLSCTKPLEPVEIQADPDQLQVALRAVLQNALDAIGRDGHIQIVLHPEPHTVHIQVHDTGAGIPPKVREHLFDPFYSLRSAGRGLGLGLSKAWRIVVSNHQGRILVHSTPGQGTCIELILPRHPGKTIPL